MYRAGAPTHRSSAAWGGDGDGFQMGSALSGTLSDCLGPHRAGLQASSLALNPFGQETSGMSAFLPASVSPPERWAFSIELAWQSGCVGKLRNVRESPKLWRPVHTGQILPDQAPLRQ